MHEFCPLPLKIYGLGIFVRVWLATSTYQKAIADRIEISTPTNSWTRIIEGLHLESLNINPYDGDTLHESPLYLAAAKLLIPACGNNVYLIFVACDVATALLLHLFAIKYKKYLEENYYVESAGDQGLTENDSFISPEYVAAAYLFNPYTIFNCVGHTTTVFANFFTALFLTGLIYGYVLLATLSLAVCVLQNLYLVTLISPLLLQFASTKNTIRKPLNAFTMVCIFWISLMYLSYYLNGQKWNFISNTYGFVLSVQDLRPNIGLFWYFFTEMFEHFRLLFICAFQINAVLLYVIPLSIRLRREPLLLAASLITLTAIFKPYPCIGDVGFVLALLCCWRHLFPYMQQGFLIISSFCMTTAIAPTVWYLWIYEGSANANFYFGVTLAFGATLVFLITDLLFAHAKREFSIKHRVKLDMKGVKLVLE